MNPKSCALVLLVLIHLVSCGVTLYQQSYYGCYAVELGCSYCYNGFNNNYYHLYEENGAVYVLNSTSSSICNSYTGGVLVAEGSCTGEAVSCTVTFTTSFRVDSLNVSTDAPPLKVSVLSQDSTFQGQISHSSISIQGGALRQLYFSAGDNSLHFIKKLSSTEYLTNFGVYEIGQQASHSGFTFSYDSYQSSTPPSNLPPPPTLPTSGALAFFTPFPGIEVTDSSKNIQFFYKDYGIVLHGKNAQTDFKGVTIYNPVYGMRSLSLYPPYDLEVSGHGTVVFQLAERSNYHGAPCEYSQSGSLEIYEYEASLSSLASFFFSTSFFSISLDEVAAQGRRSVNSADAMAFDLF